MWIVKSSMEWIDHFFENSFFHGIGPENDSIQNSIQNKIQKYSLNALIYFVCQGQNSTYPEKPSPSLFGNPLRFHQRQLLVVNCHSFDKWSFYLCQLLEFPSRRFAQPPSNCTGDDIFWCHSVLQFTLCMNCFVEVSCCWCTVLKKIISSHWADCMLLGEHFCFCSSLRRRY